MCKLETFIRLSSLDQDGDRLSLFQMTRSNDLIPRDRFARHQTAQFKQRKRVCTEAMCLPDPSQRGLLVAETG